MQYSEVASARSVSVGFIRALIERIEADGVSREALLTESVVTEGDLRDPHGRVSLDTLDELVERAAMLTANTALGLDMWGPRTFAAFGVAGLATTVAASFSDSVQLIERYCPIFTSERLLRVRNEHGHVVVSFLRSSHSSVAHRAYVEGGMSAFALLLRQCAGVHGKASFVHFDYAAPSYADLYADAVGCTPVFGAAVAEFGVRTEIADAPHLNYAPALRERLCSFADALLREQASHTAMHERVFRILCNEPRNHRLSMEEVAEQVGVSTRSLRRKLLAEGSPFPTITQRALRFHAELLLRDATRSVKEVAFVLGFRDPSTFHRAVRRWSGQSPSALRAELARAAQAWPPADIG